MKALVKYGNKPKQLEIRNVPVPKIGPNDVLLKTKAVGICGWDIEMWLHTMANPVTVPVVQGHEFCGVIEQTGDNVKDFKQGDRIVSETAAVICENCNMCKSGNYHLCPDRKGFGYGVDGALTDFVRVPARCLHHIPENISFEHAAITEPACVAYQALMVLSNIKPKTPVLIIGPGPIGLFCVQVTKAAGVSPVIVAGTDKDGIRFECAEKIGADKIINVNQINTKEYILSEFKDGIPLVVDAAGNKHSLKLAVDTVACSGQITKIGWGPEPVDFSLDPLLSKAARLQGTFSHNRPTWQAVLKMMANKQINMAPMISKVIKLDQWLQAFEDIEHGKAIKIVVKF